MARDDERPTDALEYYRAALAIRQKRLPAEHPDIAKSHFLIASVLSDLGRHREARAALDRAEAIRGDAPFEDVAREADYHEVADKLRDAETRAPAQAPVPPLDAGPRPGP
jgi:tetratricopeptide (TPR) repeat protein